MKKINWLILILLALTIALAACGKKNFKVIFDSNGGSAVAAIETDGKTRFQLPTPTKDGYEFEGWYYDNESFREQFTVGSLIASDNTSDIKVYAKWKEILVSTQGLEFELLDDGSYAVTGYSGTSERVVVAGHNQAPVTVISEEAFLNNTLIKSVVVSDAVKNIGVAAFKGCTEITSISLPFVGSSRESKLSQDAVLGHIFGSTETYDIFEGTTQQHFNSSESLYYYIPRNLIEIKITDAEIIPYGAFYGCKYIKNIELNDGISAIYPKAFENCSVLKGIYLSSTIAEIGSLAFSGSVGLKIYTDAESKPEDWASNWNKGNSPVYWGVKKNSFGQNGIYQYLIENNAVSITNYVSDELNNVMPSVIENKPVTKIKSYAFTGSNIFELSVPDSVTNIEISSFIDANLLNTLDLPFLGDTAYSAEKSFLGHLFGAIDTSTNKEMTATSLRKVVLRGGMLAEKAFSGCDRLTEIKLPLQITTIEESSFHGCQRLTKVDAPSTVTKILKNAFAGCAALNDFKMPKNLVSIGESAFHGCAALEEITIPSGVKTLPNDVFLGCSSLEKAVLPAAMTEIGASAFKDCAKLTDLTLPDELKTIGPQAFNGCATLPSVIIPPKTQLIDATAFENCAAMRVIYIPKSVITIGVHAFRGCSSLTIYAKAATRPNGWLEQWNVDNRTVYWNADGIPE